MRAVLLGMVLLMGVSAHARDGADTGGPDTEEEQCLVEGDPSSVLRTGGFLSFFLRCGPKAAPSPLSVGDIHQATNLPGFSTRGPCADTTPRPSASVPISMRPVSSVPQGVTLNSPSTRALTALLLDRDGATVGSCGVTGAWPEWSVDCTAAAALDACVWVGLSTR